MTATAPPTPLSDVSPRSETAETPSLNAAIRHSTRERLALLGLLVGTGVLYIWNLGASGYGNDFYAAAVQAGTKSWKAFFFGSFDSSNFITVDKPPAALWPMELSGRIFGFNSWSMLLPQALEGVLTVWLLYATVRRWFGATAGLLAGALLAITPVAVLMFRFNNPDALMTLLVVVAAYCTTRALEKASTRWLLLAGLVIGFSFLAKGLQPFTVLPALALAYVVAAPTGLGRRVWQLLAAGAALVVGAGWWVLTVDLTPAANRPYIGGSGDNTALGLAFGYNGVSRLTGTSGGGPGGGGANFSGSAGIGRLFNSLNGGQIAWLLPTALLAAVALAVVTHRLPRTDRTRAALLLWGGWLLVTGAVLSFASGIIHTYYAVELAPAISALVAIGAVTLWRRRGESAARLALAAGVLVTGLWSYALLHRATGWHPWVSVLVVLASAVAAVALAAPAQRFARAAAVAIVAGLVAITGGSAAYAFSTAATPNNGATPSAGPTATGATGGFGGRGGPGGAGNAGGAVPAGGIRPAFPGGGTAPGGTTGRPFPSGGARAGGGQTANAALTALLKATTTKWAAAAVGSQSAAPLELASGKAVIAIGGFSGSDDAPTLAQFQKLVADGQVSYYLGDGQGGLGGGNTSIATWVAAHFTATTVGGSTVYDLTKATS
jgi:4-amino-4-deoxy-L-arabinose transferase-like glycosyltransferase